MRKGNGKPLAAALPAFCSPNDFELDDLVEDLLLDLEAAEAR